MPLTYNSFTTSLSNMIVVPVNDPGFVTALPNIIADAENRLYRELQLLSTIVRSTANALVAGNRNFTLPTDQGTFVVIEQFNAISPAGTTNPDAGTRNSLLPVSKEYLDAVFPSATGSAVPQFFAPISQTSWIVGPWPDAAYTIEAVGTIRPAPLSATNQTTFLSTYLEDLMLAASLVFASGYQLNFSAMGDNPQSGVTWESHVRPLIESARTEEMMKRFGAQGWSSKPIDNLATPPRT